MTVDNLGQIVCTSCIQTAANRVICLVSQHWNGFESFFLTDLVQPKHQCLFINMSIEQYLNELSVRLAYKRQQMDLKVFVKMTLFKSVQDKLFGWPSYKQSDVFFYNTDIVQGCEGEIV